MPREFREKPLSQLEWYDTARAKAKSFLPELDPNLEVDVEERLITPVDKTKGRYTVLVLFFRSKNDPSFRWKMRISENHDYLDNRFRQAVERAYRDVKESKG